MPDLDFFLSFFSFWVPGEYQSELITLLLLPGEKPFPPGMPSNGRSIPQGWLPRRPWPDLFPSETKVSDDCCVMKNKELVEANMSMKTCDFFSPSFLRISEAPCFIPPPPPPPCFPPVHLLLPAEETFVLFKWLDYESQSKLEGLF